MSYSQHYQGGGGNPYENSGAAEAGYGGVSIVPLSSSYSFRSLFVIQLGTNEMEKD